MIAFFLLLHLLGNSSHPTYPFSLDRNCSFQAILFFVSDNLFLFQLRFYHQDILSLETIVQKTSHNVANRFQVKDRGYIREGYYADLAVLDLDTPYTVSQDNILYKCGWSPFDGHTFKSSIFMTIVNGNVAFKNGKVEENLPNGMQIEFDR